jgi:hypothetical protein
MRFRVFGFLRDEGNRAVLAWIGSGLLIVATGILAAFAYFFSPNHPIISAPIINGISVHNASYDKSVLERREASTLKPQFMLRSLMHHSKIDDPRFETVDAADG